MRRSGKDQKCNRCGREIPKGAPNFYFNPRATTENTAGCENCKMPVWYNRETGQIEKAEEFKDYSLECVAKFDGTCKSCGLPTVKGITILKLCNDGHTWIHTYCEDKTKDETTDETVEVKPEIKPVQPIPTVPTVSPNVEKMNPITKMIWDEIEPLVKATETKASENNEASANLLKLVDEIAEAQEKLKRQIATRPVQTLEVVQLDGTKITVDNPHPMLAELIEELALRHNVYLYGPAGTGKSTGARQAAEALSLPFASVQLNRQSTPSLLVGFMDAHGNYVETDFYRCFKNGGVFLIDEMDNASGNLLTTLNSALANGHMGFPCGQIEKSKDFRCVGTGNTCGRGADRQFNERQQLDAATIDRFAFLEWGYDEKSERMWTLAVNPNADKWVSYVQALRANAVKNSLRVQVTPRASISGAEKLLQYPNMPFLKLAERYIFKGLDKDTVSKLIAGVK